MVAKKHGAVSVVMMNSFVVDPVEDISNRDAMFRSLVEKLINLPMGSEWG